DFQVDSLEKLEFLPNAISSLKKLSDHGYELLMVSNQDGRGTASFPEEDFQKPHQKMLSILRNEGVEFSEIFIDDSFEEDKSPNRKPNTVLLTTYLVRNQIDMDNSYVIGDRKTDVQLAANLGCKSILLSAERDPDASFCFDSWIEITDLLCGKRNRRISLTRNTRETKISLLLDLDGTGKAAISTGLNFFDHMLDQ